MSLRNLAVDIAFNTETNKLLEANSAVDEFKGNVTDTTDELGKTEETSRGLFDTLADNWGMVTVLAGTTGAAMEGFARTQGETNATFDRAAIATGISSDALRDLAVDMADTTTSTSQQAEAFEMLIQRGIDTEEQFRDIIPHVSNLGTATGQDLQPALESADRLLKPFGENLDDLGDNVDQMGRIMLETDIPLSTLERNLGRVPDELQALEFGLDDAAAGIEMFRDQGYSGQESVREFRKAVSESEGDMDAFLETMGLTNDEWEEYQSKVEPVIGLTEDYAAVNEDNMTVMQKLSENMSNLMVEYGGFAQAAGMLAPIMIGLGPAIKGVQLATQLFNTTLWASPITWVVAGIIGLIAVIWLLWDNWDAVSGWLVDGWNWTLDLGISIFTSLIDFFSGLPGQVWDIFTSMLSFLLDLFFTYHPIGIVMSIWGEVMDYLSGIDLISIGENIIQGLINGITNMAGRVWDKITEIGEGIKDKFGWVLKYSPSQVFEDFGMDTMLGYTIGFENQAEDAIDTSEQVARDLASSFNPDIDNPDNSSYPVSSGGGSIVIGDVYVDASGARNEEEGKRIGNAAGREFKKQIYSLIDSYNRQQEVRGV